MIMYSAFGVDHGVEVSKAFKMPFRKPKVNVQQRLAQQGIQPTSGPTTPKPPGQPLGQRMRSMNPFPKIKSAFSRPPNVNAQQRLQNSGISAPPTNNPPAANPPPATNRPPAANPPPAANRPPDVSKPVTSESTPWERMNDSMKKNPGAWVAGGTAGGAGVTYLSTRRR